MRGITLKNCHDDFSVFCATQAKSAFGNSRIAMTRCCNYEIDYYACGDTGDAASERVEVFRFVVALILVSLASTNYHLINHFSVAPPTLSFDPYSPTNTYW